MFETEQPKFSKTKLCVSVFLKENYCNCRERASRTSYVSFIYTRTFSKAKPHITEYIYWFMIGYVCVIHVCGIIGGSYEQDQKMAALNSSEMYLSFS
jgi:hypothetical protein